MNRRIAIYERESIDWPPQIRRWVANNISVHRIELVVTYFSSLSLIRLTLIAKDFAYNKVPVLKRPA